MKFPQKLQAFVDEEFARGRYSAKEEVLIHALRELKREREEAISGVKAGLDDMGSGRMQPLDEAFRDLKKEFGVSDS